MLFRNFFNSQEKFPLIALLFPRLYAILMRSPSSSSPAPSIMKNLEEWELVKDKEGRLVKIVVHRNVKQI